MHYLLAKGLFVPHKKHNTPHHCSLYNKTLPHLDYSYRWIPLFIFKCCLSLLRYCCGSGVSWGGWYTKRTRVSANFGMAAEWKCRLAMFCFVGLKYSKIISPPLHLGSKSLRITQLCRCIKNFPLTPIPKVLKVLRLMQLCGWSEEIYFSINILILNVLWLAFCKWRQVIESIKWY